MLTIRRHESKVSKLNLARTLCHARGVWQFGKRFGNAARFPQTSDRIARNLVPSRSPKRRAASQGHTPPQACEKCTASSRIMMQPGEHNLAPENAVGVAGGEFKAQAACGAWNTGFERALRREIPPESDAKRVVVEAQSEGSV
eukprot:scaffold1960_cov242-Pinguiococcus_pyrenoidosus.AAC.17